MKYTLLSIVLCFVLFAGCKKDSAGLSIKQEIQGEWHYKSYDVKYYDQNFYSFYDAIAGSYNLNNYPALLIYGDGTCSFGANAETYQVKSSGGVDSLIVSSGINGGSRFHIVSISQDQMQLESDGGPGIVFNNKSQYANYAYSHSTSVLIKSK